jgi:acetyltransferase-like isoleucine patch superfamily enzyme
MISFTKLLFSLMRSFIYLKYFTLDRDKAIFIASNATVRNPKNMTFSSGASFGHHLWLECVTDYYNYKYEPEIIFGDKFLCGNNVHIGAAGKIKFGSNVLLGSHILITDHAHGIYNGCDLMSSPFEEPLKRKLSCGIIDIGDNVWIGDGVKIIGSIKIGSGAIVGAGSVVTKNIAKNTIVCGSPAKIVKQWCLEENIWKSIK